MKLSLLVSLFLLVLAAAVRAEEVTLTKDEADTVKMILTKDKMMADLIKAQPGLEELGKLLHMIATGPVKLAVQWNQAAIEGWRKANAALVKIEKDATCRDIELQIAGGTPNEKFFDNFSKARGCD